MDAADEFNCNIQSWCEADFLEEKWPTWKWPIQQLQMTQLSSGEPVEACTLHSLGAPGRALMPTSGVSAHLENLKGGTSGALLSRLFHHPAVDIPRFRASSSLQRSPGFTRALIHILIHISLLFQAYRFKYLEKWFLFMQPKDSSSIITFCEWIFVADVLTMMYTCHMG